MNCLELVHVSGRHLLPLDLCLEPGLHAVVGAPEHESRELVGICAGIVPPRKGVVRVGGQRPFRSPATRRRIGALLDVEAAPNGPTVEAWITRALSLHGVAGTARAILHAAELDAWLPRPPGSLSRSECRALALALALGLPDPSLLVLHEPFDAGFSRDVVKGRLGERAARGTIVLVILASASEAGDLRAAPLSLRTRELSRFTAAGAIPAPARRSLDGERATDEARP